MLPLQVVLTLSAEGVYPFEALKEALERDGLVQVVDWQDVGRLAEILQTVLPDLVLIDADSLNEAGQDVNQVCQSFRFAQLLSYRPVVVLHVSEAPEETQRIEYFVNGADDVLSQTLSDDELRVRLLAHLRRNMDTLTSRTTQLPNLQLITRMLDRALVQDQPWALALLDVQHFQAYADSYGRVPAQQMLKTTASLMANLLRPPDWSGHTDAAQFAILTQPDKAEKLVGIFCRQFDALVPTFYSEQDQSRGFIVAIQGASARRVPLMRLNGGVVHSNVASYSSHEGVIMACRALMRQMVSQPGGSHWVSDRLKLTGTAEAVPEVCEPQRVLVLEDDAAMAYLLKTTLELQGFVVEVATDDAEALEAVDRVQPQAMVMDALLQNQPKGWALCQQVKQRWPAVRVVMATTLHDRDRAMRSGADVYLPKPFDLLALLQTMTQLLNQEPLQPASQEPQYAARSL